MIYATGAAELRHVAGVCRREAAGSTTVNDIGREMRGARSVIRSAVITSVLAKLPKRGGLNVWVAESRISVTTRTGGKRSVTTVTVSKAGHDLEGLDSGLVVHPFYGKSPWYDQGVPPFTISGPIVDEGTNQLEVAVVLAAEALAERIARS